MTAAARFDLVEARLLLGRTPHVLETLLRGLPRAWETADEGEGTFSPREVLGHLIQGEREDWIPRAQLILERGEARSFEPFERFAHRKWFDAFSTGELLAELHRLRATNLETLDDWKLSERDLERRGRHPDFGPVTLRQLLSTWVVHDLNHLAQISRVMAKHYAGDVGPWRAYLPILGR